MKKKSPKEKKKLIHLSDLKKKNKKEPENAPAPQKKIEEKAEPIEEAKIEEKADPSGEAKVVNQQLTPLEVLQYEAPKPVQQRERLHAENAASAGAHEQQSVKAKAKAKKSPELHVKKTNSHKKKE